MMKQEFEKMINTEVSQEQWETIHTVYQWHPAITDTDGKKQIALLFKTFGMVVFYDMKRRAEEVEVLENQKQMLRCELDSIEKKIQDLARL